MGNEHYAAVIADLIKKRDALNATISSLQALSGGDIPTTLGAAKPGAAATSATMQAHPKEGQFLGMSIVEGADIILNAARRKMKTSEIVEQLEAGGMEFTSANVTNTVGSVLNRRMHKHGDIVSPERGYWGLKEWYPGRTFGKKASSDDSADSESPMSSTNEPSQPSPQENVVPMQKAVMPGSDLL
ncbi:HTH domain-containing protein [uncultured Algimonas sp.]|uniref:HTH domain-containing protein n=1 Tax=uncultured Algimonas sp. TaxID=1547920 RepID=UPI0026098390|nr:HTH domain-containing protein [uncultured Algimonas sp.]